MWQEVELCLETIGAASPTRSLTDSYAAVKKSVRARRHAESRTARRQPRLGAVLEAGGARAEAVLDMEQWRHDLLKPELEVLRRVSARHPQTAIWHNAVAASCLLRRTLASYSDWALCRSEIDYGADSKAFRVSVGLTGTIHSLDFESGQASEIGREEMCVV